MPLLTATARPKRAIFPGAYPLIASPSPNALTDVLGRFVSSVAGTGAALYLVLNQDLSHGSHGDVNHDEEPEKLANQPEQAQKDKAEADKPDLEPKADNKKAGGAKVQRDDNRSEQDAPSNASEEDLEKTSISGRKSDIQEGLAKQKGEPSVHEPADDKSSTAPDEADKVRNPHAVLRTH